MIKKLIHKIQFEHGKSLEIDELHSLATLLNKNDFISKGLELFSEQAIEFYRVVGIILNEVGFNKVLVTREGDTNNRMDAIIVDDYRSIPIEIKSPRETNYINIKSIRQSLENKIVLLSREFYPTTLNTTTLAVGFTYPNERSGVLELIEDIKSTFNINIGIIDFGGLLSLYYEKIINKEQIDLELIYNLQGKFKY